MIKIEKMYDRCLEDIRIANSPDEEYPVPEKNWFYELANDKSHIYYKIYMKPYLREKKLKNILR